MVTFSPASEMWFRYYIRFQSGFTWGRGVNMKTIYCNRGHPGTFYFGLHDGVIGGHVEVDSTGGIGNHYSTVTWAEWQGGAASNGKFHVLEVHARMNSSGRAANGVLEFWLDGTRIYGNSTVHFSNSTGAQFSNCAVGENHRDPRNGADAYVDFDDIAVSATGYIGPIRQ